MLISEMIAKLEYIKDFHGDLEVRIWQADAEDDLGGGEYCDFDTLMLTAEHDRCCYTHLSVGTLVKDNLFVALG